MCVLLKFRLKKVWISWISSSLTIIMGKESFCSPKIRFVWTKTSGNDWTGEMNLLVLQHVIFHRIKKITNDILDLLYQHVGHKSHLFSQCQTKSDKQSESQHFRLYIYVCTHTLHSDDRDHMHKRGGVKRAWTLIWDCDSQLQNSEKYYQLLSWRPDPPIHSSQSIDKMQLDLKSIKIEALLAGVGGEYGLHDQSP